MASFNDLDTLRQMGLVSLVYNGNHQLCLKFSCAGTGITFTGSLDSALIIAAIKQQMTVDNIGLHGMIGPMGGMMTEYVPFPTVSASGFIMPGHAVTINAGSISTGWYVGSTGQPFVYESTKSYGARGALDAIGGNDIDPTVFALVDSSGELAVKNISNSSVNVEVIYVSVCSSNLATVITVYNSSNVAYNAFQYTSDGTDYYYVLDGTQTDWTDDLTSIGYSLTPVIVLPTVTREYLYP